MTSQAHPVGRRWSSAWKNARGKTSLEAGSQRELYDSAAAISVGLSEGAIDLRPGRVESCRGVDARELGVVESVVELAAKLKLQLLMDGEIPKGGEVGLVLPGSSKNDPARVSDVTKRGRSECAGIEKAIAVSNSESELRIAGTIAAIYKDRREIELFSKALKQSLKVKSFVGTSRNALMIQIWTALTAMLRLKWMRHLSKAKWSFSNLASHAADEPVHLPGSAAVAGGSLRHPADCPPVGTA